MLPAGFKLTRGLEDLGVMELAAGRRAVLRSLRSLRTARRIFWEAIVSPLLFPYKEHTRGTTHFKPGQLTLEARLDVLALERLFNSGLSSK